MSGVWALVGVVYIEDFCVVVSTVVTGVTFLLLGGDCGDGFSTSFTGVGVLCTILTLYF